jgi:hypothetical protein
MKMFLAFSAASRDIRLLAADVTGASKHGLPVAPVLRFPRIKRPLIKLL